MTYRINKTNPFDGEDILIEDFTGNGSVHPLSNRLATGALKANTSISLIGRGNANYGERIAESMVNMLENFSGSTPPANPINGQIWASRIDYIRNDALWYQWDKSLSTWSEFTPKDGIPDTFVDGEFWFDGNTLRRAINKPDSPLNETSISVKFATVEGDVDPNAVGYKPIVELLVYNGGVWLGSGDVTASPIAPTRVTTGKVWYDTIENKLKIYVGNQFISVFDNYLSTAGGVMHGDIDMGENFLKNVPDPVDDGDAINKAYFLANIPNKDDSPVTSLTDLDDVDVSYLPVSPAGLSVLQWDLESKQWRAARLNISDIMDLNNTDITTDEIKFLAGIDENISDALSDRLKLDGSESMLNDLSMASNKITDLANPEDGADAVNKRYVETLIASSKLSFLEELDDVDYSSQPTNLQILKYSEDTGVWNPSALNLADIVDLSATGVTATEFEYLLGLDQNVDAKFDSIDDRFNGLATSEQGDLADTAIQPENSVGDLKDVDMSTAPVENQVLTWNGNAFAPADVPDTSGDDIDDNLSNLYVYASSTSEMIITPNTPTIIFSYDTISDPHEVLVNSSGEFDLTKFPNAGEKGIYRITATVAWKNSSNTAADMLMRIDVGVASQTDFKMPTTPSDNLYQTVSIVRHMVPLSDVPKITLYHEGTEDHVASMITVAIEVVDLDIS